MLSESMVRDTAEAGGSPRSARRVLFRVNEPADCVHLLLDGAIEIVRSTRESPDPTPVAYITPGELIGDMALFTGTPRRRTAACPSSRACGPSPATTSTASPRRSPTSEWS